MYMYRMAYSVRPWLSGDKTDVHAVLTEAAFSNVWPGFVLTLNRRWYLYIIVSLSVLALATTYSIWVSLGTIFFTVVTTYLVHLLVACIYIYGPPLADMDNVHKEYIQPEDCNFWVAESDSSHEIVGTIAIVRKDTNNRSKLAWLRRMAVSKSHRNKGVARLLVKQAINFCKQKQYKKIELITTEVHTAARNFYLKMGFVCKCFKPYLYFSGWIHIWTYEFELDLCESLGE